MSKHSIKVVRFDKNTFSTYTNETNKMAPIWNHKIILKELDEKTTRYTDEVEINAGWSLIFCGHRQRKWLKLLK